MRIITIYNFGTVRLHPQLSPNNLSNLNFYIQSLIKKFKAAGYSNVNQKAKLHKALRLTTKILNDVESAGKNVVSLSDG
jgi:hypothetical protein